MLCLKNLFSESLQTPIMWFSGDKLEAGVVQTCISHVLFIMALMSQQTEELNIIYHNRISLDLLHAVVFFRNRI